jgi:hypothetical protein
LLVAHTGRAGASRDHRAPDQVVWVYDPTTARYEGTAEVEL